MEKDIKNYDIVEGKEIRTLMPLAMDLAPKTIGLSDLSVHAYGHKIMGAESMEVVDIESFYGEGGDDGGGDGKPLEPSEADKQIVDDIANETGDTININVPEGEQVQNLTIPTDATAAPTINGVFANGATVTSENSNPITLNNTSDEPTNINVNSNGDIYMSGQYNNVNIDGSGISVPENGSAAQISGNLNIADGNDSASVTAEFVGDDKQEVKFNGSEIDIENTESTESTDLVVNAPNATVTMDGVYDEVEVTSSDDTLILKSGFHAHKLLVKKGNVVIYGDNINDFADEFVCTGTVTPTLVSGETEQFILDTLAAATGTSVQITLQDGMVVRNLVIPSETNCSPKITGVFANGAIVVFEGPSNKFITLTNTNPNATDINVKANGTVYLAGSYNDVTVDGKGVSVSSGNYPLIYGDINIIGNVSSVTVSCKFESSETQQVNYNGEKINVSNNETAGTSNVVVNATNASLTIGGKYNNLEANCISMTLNATLHANKLVANCDTVTLNGVDINDFADDVVCSGTISPIQFNKLTCSPGESTLGEDTVGNGLAFGAFASGKSKWNLNGHTYTNQRSGSGIVLLRNKPILDIYGPGKMTTNATDAYGLWVSGEEAVLNIYGGDYEGCTHCLYAENGTINVYGGTFKLLDAATADRDTNNNLKFLVNCLDASYTGGTAHINIYGGKFYEYNPAISYSEPGGPVSFVAPGYHVVESTEDEIKVYEVVKD